MNPLKHDVFSSRDLEGILPDLHGCKLTVKIKGKKPKEYLAQDLNTALHKNKTTLVKVIDAPDVTKRVMCAHWGHSNIVTSFFGYIYCARCGEQIGDYLGSVWRNERAVQVGHDCEVCHENYGKLQTADKFLAPDPFKENG